jgi:NAD+ diphosphatase
MVLAVHGQRHNHRAGDLSYNGDMVESALLPLFVFRGAELLVELKEGGAVPASPRTDVDELRFEDCRVIEWPVDAAVPEPVVGLGLRPLHALMEPRSFALAGKAFQLLGWTRSHRFCGVCGAQTVPHAHEVARECVACKALVYPRLNPAVIVLVTRGNEALLSRSAHFAPGMYSCQAGFVAPGESLEEAVKREVREEVGVELADIHYFGSQSWPFPNSLMIGFTATWVAGEIVCEPGEIEDARWYSLEALPGLPGNLSIARALIDNWVQSHGGTR